MDDRTMLEMAARAAGLKEWGWMGGSLAHVVDNTWAFFDPLNEDGDALRLAVKLEIDICRFNDAARACYWNDEAGDGSSSIDIDHDDDPYAATRRAIVRAAAAIGREMK